MDEDKDGNWQGIPARQSKHKEYKSFGLAWSILWQVFLRFVYVILGLS